VFGRLISDVKQLEASGIEVANAIVVKAVVVCIDGDNLGSHYICGFEGVFLCRVHVPILFGYMQRGFRQAFCMAFNVKEQINSKKQRKLQ